LFAFVLRVAKISSYAHGSILCADLLVPVPDLQNLVNSSIPRVDDLIIEGLLPNAVGYALQLAILCYLDTLLTSLVVDKMVQERDSSDETTNKAKELSAQGLANGAVAIFGGLPGAQATIRSVLILKEGGTMRLAGIAAGVSCMHASTVFSPGTINLQTTAAI
jgi:MFS superfamily sulfate permease-like transporter